MFTPNDQDPNGAKTVLFIFVIAMLASLCSRQMAHGAERFLPGDRQGATLALRPDASLAGDEIRLRQIARWGDADKATLDPIGDLVVARFGDGQQFKTLSLAELKTLLADAGVNLATVNFVGPTACRIERTDSGVAPAVALDQYTAAANGKPTAAAAPTADAGGRTLRQALADDLAGKLGISAADLELSFKTEDEIALRRREPHDTFDIRPQRTGDLGDVSWVVSVSGEKRLFLQAHARAWQNQVVASAPLAGRQPIGEGDVTTRRQLVDRMSADPVIALDKVVGQAAARDVKPGMVFTAHMVDPIKLVQAGQDVSVDTAAGGIRLLTAARALSDGVMGQTVQLRNEQTRQTFNATVTGPKRVSLGGTAMAGSVR